MRLFALALVILCFIFSSLSWAQKTPLEQAYSLYYKGDKVAAIEVVEDYIKDNREPNAYYFLGYAYYEMQQMDKAREYFSEAFKLRDFYSPMEKK
jgi:TolA-binding protein